MVNDSPAVIIFDINGNPIGSVLDGSIHRLQTEDKIASWFGSAAPTVGQKTMAQSIPVVLPIDQTVSITATIGIVNQGNPGTIGNSWFMELTDGTNVLGTSTHPIRIDPVGTTIQPISGTITANAGTGTFNVLGTVTANQGTNPWTDDVTDRSNRLLGIIYGSQGQQLKQTAVNFNTQVEVAVGGALVDPRSIRTLTSSDTVTVVQPTAANLLATVNQGTSPWVTNITQFGSNNVVTGVGASGVGIPRVTVSNDSNILATQSGTWTINQGVGGTSPWMVQGTTADGYALVGNTLPISATDSIGIVRALNAITDGGKILAVQDETANDLLREILDKLKVMSFYLSQMADIDLE